ncbi:hypothetical protein Poli38472_009780 [Pythium oligandrum]|uniref:Uncharacterized protein n=1 Tax=Pythium oligandrum TaxID=41045 RepID=A0A8K1CFC1_PYTOL|nr:hypothetical protein Poli38472_009780 [Pythium oligandrum]|eukprot:TMW62287.1 hypothetical protein Poli38472_009780 [Pythium oligandrum]
MIRGFKSFAGGAKLIEEPQHILPRAASIQAYTMELQEHGRALSGKLTSKLSSIQSMRWLGGKTSSTDMEADQDKSSSDLTALGFGMLVVGLVFAVCLIAPT